jgi:hypothetical protein
VKGNRRLRSLPGVASEQSQVEGRVFGTRSGRVRTLRTLRPPTIPLSRSSIDQSENPRDDPGSLPDDGTDNAPDSSDVFLSEIRSNAIGPIGWHQVGLHLCDVLGR